MQIVFIGAGRLATNLAPALQRVGHSILQVYSRTMDAAKMLADRVGAIAITDLQKVSTEADVYVFSVTDTALPQLILQMPPVSKNSVFLHTAGSVPMKVFEGRGGHYGVFYPMQTFSKGCDVDFKTIPVFIEGNDSRSQQVVKELAISVSENVRELSSEGRRHLHLAAVFACNFANHCYELSAEILAKYGVPFEVMLPLVDETAAKVHKMSPRDAQTGPAVRCDEKVLEAQKGLLTDNPLHAQIYDLMSRSISQSSLIDK